MWRSRNINFQRGRDFAQDTEIYTRGGGRDMDHTRYPGTLRHTFSDGLVYYCCSPAGLQGQPAHARIHVLCSAGQKQFKSQVKLL